MARLLVPFAMLVAAAPAAAQVTVQQPVVANFGVTTTVSVPDRGTALLGGVSRSTASRNRYGFWPRSGSSFGRQTSHSSITASVHVHDLRAMDEYLLGLDTGIARPTLPAITARGMLERDRITRAERRRRTVEDSKSTVDVDARAVSERSAAERSFARGVAAEREGRPRVARLHFEMAARHGSIAAREKLGEPVVSER